MVEAEDFHFFHSVPLPSPRLAHPIPSGLGPGPGSGGFPLYGCTVQALPYPRGTFRVTGMSPDGLFSVTQFPITPRSARLTLPECHIMTVHVTREAKNKRIKVVFNKHREPPGGSYSGAVQRLIGLTCTTGMVIGFDQDNALVKADHDGGVLIVPLRHCALYTA